MAIKKISELDTKNFLGKSGAAEHSYVLINYAEGNNDTPVTYKATVEELGKAVANNLGLVAKSNNGLYQLNVGNNASNYTSTTVNVGGGGAAPEGANYIFESGYDYYVSSTSDLSNAYNLGYAAAKSRVIDEMDNSYCFIVADSDGIIHKVSGSDISEFSIAPTGANYIFESGGQYFVNPDDSLTYAPDLGTVIVSGGVPRAGEPSHPYSFLLLGEEDEYVIYDHGDFDPVQIVPEYANYVCQGDGWYFLSPNGTNDENAINLAEAVISTSTYGTNGEEYNIVVTDSTGQLYRYDQYTSTYTLLTSPQQ